jgi:uncharacterized membrane protein
LFADERVKRGIAYAKGDKAAEALRCYDQALAQVHIPSPPQPFACFLFLRSSSDLRPSQTI